MFIEMGSNNGSNIYMKGKAHFTSVLPFHAVEKDDVNGRKATLQGEGLISVPPASFRGRPMSRFTHFRSLQDLLCDAKSLGVTLAPLQSTILQNVFTFS